MKQTLFFMLLSLTYLTTLFSQNTETWYRYPAISPDGKWIVFSSQGDLYKVSADGGAAVMLTKNDAFDFAPVWSHDSKTIAFASARYGNFDIFTIPAEGGNAVRITMHSNDDIPYDFSADDKSVLFKSVRMDASTNQQFPTGALPELYQVEIKTGKLSQILTTPAENARYSKDGTMLYYHDAKGYEDPLRKHHTSSVARDVWKYNVKTGEFTKLTSFAGEDRNPVLAADEKEIYYLSESNGSFNVYKMSTTGANPTAVTRLKNHPVRHLSISNAGILCFSYHGEIYTLKDGGSPKKLNISISVDNLGNQVKNMPVLGDVSEMAVSPNGKEVAFVKRGEVFVTSVKEGTTKRVTNTPEQERSVSFSPDGRSLVYAGERNGSWNIYTSTIARKEEKYFFNSTLLKEEGVVTTDKEEFQPAWSPDGKEIAYLEERTALKVINLDSKKTRLIMPGDKNYSYSDGDQAYTWSPDGKWFLVNFLQDNQWISQCGLVSAEGGKEVFNLTKSGYNNFAPKWAMDGKMMTWFSDRDGMKNDASWGGEGDVYGMFFTKEAFDRFKLSKEDFEILKEEEEAAKKDSLKTAEASKKDDKKDDKKDGKKDDKKDKALEPIKIELSGIEDRKVRLTIHSSRLADAVLSKDGEKLYYFAQFEKGYDIWQTELRTKETKIFAKLGANGGGEMYLDKDGKNLFVLADGNMSKIQLDDGKTEPVKIKGDMFLDETAERSYLFEHIWRQVEKKFYVKDLHGVDWNFYKKEYSKKLPAINNNYDYAELLSELLGELNASHTGARYRPGSPNGDRTAALGVFYDNNFNGKGLKITEIMVNGPLSNDKSKIKAGTIIEKVDGTEVNNNEMQYEAFNLKAGKNTLLSLFNPVTGERWDEVVKPISMGEENGLKYKRWVENCRKIVDSLSGGKVGYVHVAGMNDPSYRVVYEEALGRNYSKKALIVDTRFNGGGWLHDDLATFLSGKKYMTLLPRGQKLGEEPQFKWTKASAVVMNEGNYSDAHMFPYTYKALGIGKLIGMPVAGTGTAVWWETLQNGIVFGIPQVGMVGNDGKFLENTELVPDIKVANEPAAVSKGRDQQLEAAVKELLSEVK
ncbi:MAG TPA: S41 family peptidase [Saprospiraceae bacterium]|nr:S41 family peptidase [Saprospiraceae bacterium]HMZ73768.1 S41 family peptidase [Saprospiraceae bacterium]HNJ62328.1 S41 family peptidase [Saprospiraceae bacterium]HNM57881.1 S41 family peptidase [Saprospiraceae bacterium]HNO36724.1 S41 family peptidase [Saprospiraceae bacterium]